MAKAGGRAACGGMKGASVRSACDGGAGAEAPGKTICDIKKGMFANGHRDLVLAQARTQRHGNKREEVRKEQGGTYMACRKLAGEKTKHEQHRVWALPQTERVRARGRARTPSVL